MNPNGNPNLKAGPGRPKGMPNKSTKAKDDFFKVFFELGGKKAVLDLFEDRIYCVVCNREYIPEKPDEPPRMKCPTCSGLLRVQHGLTKKAQFILQVLPQLMPKKTDVSGSLGHDVSHTLSDEDRAIIEEIKRTICKPKPQSPTQE